MRRARIALAVLALVCLVGAVFGVRYWWDYGYSRGTRTGYLRKLSLKGPPYCKYVSGELALAGGMAAGQAPEVWQFTVDNANEHGPLMDSLHAAEKAGKLVTLQYRQDLHMWWRCSDNEYYVVGIDKE